MGGRSGRNESVSRRMKFLLLRSPAFAFFVQINAHRATELSREANHSDRDNGETKPWQSFPSQKGVVSCCLWRTVCTNCAKTACGRIYFGSRANPCHSGTILLSTREIFARTTCAYAPVTRRVVSHAFRTRKRGLHESQLFSSISSFTP